jgi:hypothetical protein
MGFHEVPWNSMRFYDVLVNRSVPTEANRGLTSYSRGNSELAECIHSAVLLDCSLRVDMLKVCTKLVNVGFHCKRLDLCWPQWVHFGLQEHHRTSWNLMEPHGIPQNLMEGSGTWRNLLVADK